MEYITIIICAYNEEKYIEKTIENLSEQDDLKFKVIIVNDGSTDSTGEKIKNLIEKYKGNLKIKYIEKTNTGLADSRNIAVKKVKTKYFMFQNVRDYIDQDAIKILNKIIMQWETTESQKIVDEVEKKELDLIKFNTKTVNKFEELISRNRTTEFENLNGENALKQIGFTDNMIYCASSYIYRTSFYLHHNFQFERGRYYEDYGTLPIIVALATNVISREETLYNYVEIEQEKDSTKENQKMFKQIEDILFIYNVSLLQIEKQENLKNISAKTAKLLKEIYTKGIIDILLKLYLKYIDKREKLERKKESNNMYKAEAKKEAEEIDRLYKEYKKKIQDTKIYRYLPINSFKDKILRTILKYDVELYFKMLLKNNK